MLGKMPNGQYNLCVNMIHSVLEIVQTLPSDEKEAIINNLDQVPCEKYDLFLKTVKSQLELTYEANSAPISSTIQKIISDIQNKRS